MSKDYQLKEVVIFVSGLKVIKGIIDEKIVHEKQTGEVAVRYFVRPYGRADFVEIPPEDIFESFKDARKHVIDAFKKSFTKKGVKKNYTDAIKKISDNYKKQMKTFDKDGKLKL